MQVFLPLANEFLDSSEPRDGGCKYHAVWLCVEYQSVCTLKIQTGFNYRVAHLHDQTNASVYLKALGLHCYWH